MRRNRKASAAMDELVGMLGVTNMLLPELGGPSAPALTGPEAVEVAENLRNDMTAFIRRLGPEMSGQPATWWAMTVAWECGRFIAGGWRSAAAVEFRSDEYRLAYTHWVGWLDGTRNSLAAHSG